MRCCCWCFVAVVCLAGFGPLAVGGGPGLVVFEMGFPREPVSFDDDGVLPRLDFGDFMFGDDEAVTVANDENTYDDDLDIGVEIDGRVYAQLLYFMNLVEVNLQGYGEYYTVDLFEERMQGSHYAAEGLVRWLRSRGLIPDDYYSVFTTIDDLIYLLVDHWRGGEQAVEAFDQRLMDAGISLFDRVYQYLLVHGAMPVVARTYARSAMEGIQYFGIPFMDALRDALITFMGDRYRMMGVPNDAIQGAVEHFREQHFTAGVEVYRAFLIGFYETVGVPLEFLHGAIDFYLNEERQRLNNGERFDQAFTLRWAAFRVYGLSDEQAKKAARHQLNLEALDLAFIHAHWAAFTRHCGLISGAENIYFFINEFDELIDSDEAALYAWAYVFCSRILGIPGDYASRLANQVYDWVSPLGSGHCLSFIDAVLAVLYRDLGVPDYALLKAIKRQREILAGKDSSFREACWRALFETLGAPPYIALLEAQRQERLIFKKHKPWSFERAHLLCLARCFYKDINFNLVHKLAGERMKTRGNASVYEVYLRAICEVIPRKDDWVEEVLYGPKSEENAGA